MNVLVLHSQVPFTHGGAEVLVDGLVNAFIERGHRAEVVALPLAWNPVERLLTSALAWSLLDLTSFNGVDVDLVVCTKYPTWAVRHPNKVLWLIHQHRQAYDLHGSALSEFGPHAEAQSVRMHVHEVDRRGIAECVRRFAISENVSNRLKRFTDVHAEALYPPVPRQGLRPEAFDPFILSVSRIDGAKRVDSIVRAWQHVRSDMTLKIVGEGPDLPALRKLVATLGLADRVELLGRVDDASLLQLYNSCRAVFYAPVDEDYGYAAVEALAAGKPVVTAPDSGGVLEFVSHNETGLVTDLDASALAETIECLADESLARHLGARGPALTEPLTWDTVVNALIGNS